MHIEVNIIKPVEHEVQLYFDSPRQVRQLEWQVPHKESPD